MLVPLGSCEMVWGVQWLSNLGLILWDFEKLTMAFNYKGKAVVLRGTEKSNVEWLGGKKFQQSLHKGVQFFALQVYPVSTQVSMSSIAVHGLEMLKLLVEYADIRLEPRTLPPHR